MVYSATSFRTVIAGVIAMAMLAGCVAQSTATVDPVPDQQSTDQADHLERLLNAVVKKWSGSEVSEVHFSRDMSTIATVYDDGHFAVWKTTGEPKPSYTRNPASPDDRYDRMAISEDGNLIAEMLGRDPVELHVWSPFDAAKGYFLTVDKGERMEEFWFTHDNHLILSVAEDSTLPPTSSLYLIGPDGQTQGQYQFPGTYVRPLIGEGNADSLDSSNEYLVAANWGGIDEDYSGFLAWRPGSAPRMVDLGCNGAGSFSSGGERFACNNGKEEDIAVWSVADATEIARWHGIGDSIPNRADNCTFFADGQGLAVEQGDHDAQFRLRTTIRLYEVVSHKIVGSHQLEPIDNRPDLVASQLGQGDTLVYGMNFAQKTSTIDNRFSVYATPKLAS